MARSKHGHEAFTGVFLLGLGIIACFDYWWPGIMFVIAASVLVSALIDGQLAHSLVTVAVLVGVGLIGVFGQLRLNIGFPLWPVLFMVIGLAFLTKTFWKRGG
ncbi:MAG TPA: hypothetical protein PLS03_01530 [Terrimicrobiaceae bacterium]|nr:hypothetical protein [Terrimicrobiaceae bacterium]